MTKPTSKQLTEWFLLSLLLVNVVYVFLGALHSPLSHIDVVANWLYKANIIYQQDFSLEFLTNWKGEFAHPHYPVLLPLLFAGIYRILGEVNVLAVSLVSPLIYLAILGMCYWLLRQMNFSQLLSLLFTYVLSMLPPLMAQAGRGHAGMADIYLSALYWVSLVWCWKAKRQPKLWWALIPVVIVGSWLKTEGVLLVIFLLLPPQKWLLRTIQVGLALSGFVLWQIVIRVYHIPASYELGIPAVWVALEKLLTIIQEMGLELMLNLNNWYIFWWVFPLLMVRGNKEEDDRWLLKILAILLGAFVLMYLVSSVPIAGYVSSSFDRLLLQTMPVWYLLFARGARSILPKVITKLERL